MDIGVWSATVHGVAESDKTEKVSMHAGYLNRTPHTGWFKQRKFIFSQLWRLEALDAQARIPAGVGSGTDSLFGF